MKKIMVFGTFDILHKGHKNFFAQAKKHGDYLIVVIARDKTVKEVKGKLPINKEKTRQKNVVKIKIAEEVLLGDLKDKYKAIKKYKPDIICLGYDQKNFVKGLSAIDVKILKLKAYKPNIFKSSKLGSAERDCFVAAAPRNDKGGAVKMHKSVGMVIRRGNKILMIDRAIYPFGWACPAGHVDSGETAVKALKREVKEETGLEVLKYKLLIHEFVDWNKCSRGVNGHDWYVYEVLGWEGRIRRNNREEKKIKWIDVEEVKNLKLEPVWEYWFKKILYERKY